MMRQWMMSRTPPSTTTKTARSPEDFIAPDAGADTNDDVALSWGDDDVTAKPDDTINAVDLKDEMQQEGETEIMKLKALVVGMTKRVDALQQEVKELRGFIVDPNSVVVYNVSRGS